MTVMNGAKYGSSEESTLSEQQLREMHDRDLFRLMMHFQAAGESSGNALRNSKPSQAPPVRKPIPTCTRRLDDDEVTVLTSNVTKERKRGRILSWIRSILLDLPFLVLFSCLTTIYCVDVIYYKYYVPMFELSARTLDDANLRKEYTYYDRECRMLDVTSHDGKGLLLTNETTPKEAVETMMIHGTSLIPKMLEVQTAKELRKYIMSRNNALTKHEKIPLSQGKNRKSFGIDATEAPIVSEALKQVANHVLFQGLIQGLVGEDPALTEITAITAWVGAPHQAWHQDVKADGSGIKFARTFSHSYSLFIALQDTTEAMGATTLCPGTHYCTNHIDSICDRYGFPLSNAVPGGIWQTGDGALLNQQVWHRGAMHSDENAPERVVFIVSFIGRPDPTRQLSRGTYFHQKWLSWGHTMQDLADADRSMAKPFSILRALSLWKPKSRNWGYDFVSSAVLRIANLQLGVAPDELPTFQERVIENIFHIPTFLQGPVSEKNSAWRDYIEATLHKIKVFFAAANVIILACYLSIVSLLSIKDRSLGPARSASYRMLFTHVLPVMLTSGVLYTASRAEWRHLTGSFLRPPFPDHLQSMNDTSISVGPTTFPRRMDVLVGNRFDAMYLGVYDRWLDYHPGNVDFQSKIIHCSRMPVALDQKCIDLILNSNVGHVLEQDWRTGCWRIMTPFESRRHAMIALKKARNTIVDRTAKSIAILLAYNRFDVPPTSMSAASIDLLKSLKKAIFLPEYTTTTSVLSKPSSNTVFAVKSGLPTLSTAASSSTIRARTSEHARWTSSRPSPTPFQVGDIVWVNYKGRGEFYRGAVVDVQDSDNALHIAYEDGDEQEGVALRLIQPELALVENGYVEHKKKAIHVKVRRVKPNGWIDIEYPDGSIEQDVRPKAFAKIVAA
ncbi:putative membrane protein (DUF2061) [Fragilaria crotonensis]|nr:putative membrane protein (DUF2061) [Fragilaria crotonensis]